MPRRAMNPTPQINSSPAKVPDDLSGLDRAIMLLGECAKHELKTGPRRELIELIGDYPPNGVTAAAWKRQLRQLRSEEAWLLGARSAQ